MTRAALPLLVLAAVAGRLALFALCCLFYAGSYPIAQLGECAGWAFRKVKS